MALTPLAGKPSLALAIRKPSAFERACGKRPLVWVGPYPPALRAGQASPGAAKPENIALAGPAYKGLLAAEDLVAYLAYLRAEFGIQTVKKYQAVSYRMGDELWSRVYLIRHFAANSDATGGHAIPSSFISGRDIPPLNSSHTVEATDLPMQVAIHTKRVLFIKDDSVQCRSGKPTAIVPRYRAGNKELCGIFVFEFDKKRIPPDEEGMALIAEQLFRHIIKADQKEIRSILRHEGLGLLNRLGLGIEALRQFFPQLAPDSPQAAAVFSRLAPVVDKVAANSGLYLAFSRNLTALMQFAQEGFIFLEPERAALKKLLMAAASPHSASSAELPLAIELEEADAQTTICFDKGKIAQVLSNLIGNSIKYQREGVPPVATLRATLTRNSQGKPISLQLTYQDNGQGIATADLQRIFLYKVRGDAQTASESSGIGLYVARILLAMMGGTIVAESEKGSYARFIMNIPLVAG